MNYATHAIEDLIQHVNNPKFPISRDREAVYDVVGFLRESHKFLLPFNGDTGVKVTSDCIDFLRMPYDMMALEYDSEIINKDADQKTNQTVKTILLVLNYENYFIIIPIIYSNNQWIINLIGFSADKTDIRIAEDGALMFHLNAHQILPNLYKWACDQYGTDEILNNYAAINAENYVSVAIQAVVATHAKNVQTVTLEAPEKLNKKRLKNNREPLYDYHVLSIFCGKEILLKRPRDRVNSALKMLNTVRLHSVRGHFKNRNGKLYWWSSHLRGNKKRGIVEKDYNLVKE